MPKVSVLFPARDAAPWVEQALASILRQTERDLEVVAVDDGSRDDTLPRLERAARADRRVRVVTTERCGLPAALERARAEARGAFLARQDADDVSHPRRLELQVARLRAEPGLAVVGARVSLFPAGQARPGMRRWVAWHNALVTHDAMADEALVDSVLCHGTAVFRADALAQVGGWQDRGWAEDMDLWLRMLAKGLKLGKCAATLYAWRQHARSATRTDPRYAAARFRALRAWALGEGFLARAGGPVTLVGVGASLAGWGEMLRAAGVACACEETTRRTAAATLARLVPPVVLVFGSRAVRERWRAGLLGRGLVERTDFTFVA